MNPYLEDPDIWPDFHTSLFVEIREELNRRLPAGYVARLHCHSWIETPGRTQTPIESGAGRSAKASKSALAAPMSTVLPGVRRTGGSYLKIEEARANRTVTIVAILSPTTKCAGEERRAYLWKRNQYFVQRINVVEIDLHRGGLQLPLGKPQPPKADYYVFVSRAADFPKTAIWPLSIRDRLSEVAIPLNPEDGVVALPLQSCMDIAYDQGPYNEEVDYSRPPRTPLSQSDSTWAKRLLTKSGHRHSGAG